MKRGLLWRYDIQGTKNEFAFPPLPYLCRTTFVTTNRAYSGSAIMLAVFMWLYFVMRVSSESAPFRNTKLLNRKRFVPNAAWSIASPPPIREKTKLARHLSLTSFKEEMRDAPVQSISILSVVVLGHQSGRYFRRFMKPCIPTTFHSSHSNID
jgi:hypothetical protein